MRDAVSAKMGKAAKHQRDRHDAEADEEEVRETTFFHGSTPGVSGAVKRVCVVRMNRR